MKTPRTLLLLGLLTLAACNSTSNPGVPDTQPPVTSPEPEPVTESPPAVTAKAVVTESLLPEVPVLPKRGRPKKAGALSRAEIQRAYRERRDGTG